MSVIGWPSVAATEPGGSPGYGVQPGDILQISVWKEPDLQLEVLVRPDGGISLPLAGDIAARGQTVEALRAEIVSRIEKYIPEPVVTVSVKEIRGNNIYVIGKVNRPGVFVLTQDIDVMQALSMAGGTTTFAALNKIVILRRDGGGQTAITFRYAEVEGGSKLEQNILLRNGDVVVVP
jgi:polysaccharide export outer membrane protein